MSLNKNAVLVLAGILIGIVIALLVFSALSVHSAGAGSITVPQTGTESTRMSSGTDDIPIFSSPDNVRTFLLSHTETGGTNQSPVSAAPGSVTSGPVSQTNGTRVWQFAVDTSTFRPDEYIVTASAVIHPVTGTALFNVLEGSRPASAPRVMRTSAIPVSGGQYFISIDPIGDRYVGEKFTVTGSTNLPADAEMLVQVYSSSFKPTQKSQSGEFSGATGTIKTSQSTAPSQASAPSPEYSTTNVQVKGVDEADIIKTDGINIYVITGKYLHILRAFPPNSAKILSTQEFYGTPLSLYVNGDHLVLICTEQKPRETWSCARGMCRGPAVMDPKTLVFVYSIRDPTYPFLARQIEIDGTYSDSRMIGNYLYFITANPADATAQDMIFPAIHDREKGAIIPLVYYFDTKDRAFSYSTVGAFDVTADGPVKAKTFLIGSAGTVYVSPTHLYVGISSPGTGLVSTRTGIYAFSLNGTAISYVAKGTVDGSLHNQFSLDEYAGNLRVATTAEEWRGRSLYQYNNVYVLDDKLNILGSLENIAPRERIYAARFMGDTLYLVTFRTTDPFFVIGLSDPRHPVILGELKIPGYSSYLHPYDSTHIIGIGKEAWGGVKVALFDVSNMSGPRLVDSMEIGIFGSDSEVLNDHKAFLFDRTKDILVLPVHVVERQVKVGGKPSDQVPNTVWGGALVYSVNPAKGFGLKGIVKHYDMATGPRSPVKRALYIDDTLYTMSQDIIVMSDLTKAAGRINAVELT